MKFTEVKTLEHLLKEYGVSSSGSPTPSGQQQSGSFINKVAGDMAKKVGAKVRTVGQSMTQAIKGTDSKTTQKIKSIVPRRGGKVSASPTIGGQKNTPDPVIKTKAGEVEAGADIYDQYGNYTGKIDSPLGDNKAGGPEKIAILNKQNDYEIIDPNDDLFVSNPQANEGKLSKLAKRKSKHSRIKTLRGKIKKLSKKRLKEADPKLFEINFNRQNLARQSLDAPVKCGFEAETFFYNVDSRGSSDDIDNMSVEEVENQFGDLPDQAFEDYQEWLWGKGQDEYLSDIITDKVNEVREDEEWLNDFIDSANGPSSEAIERYKADFEENDPKEYENREEDGWDYMNWVREYVEEEYEEEYLQWLEDAVEEEYDLKDEARDAAEQDYSMSDWIYDQWSYMSSFLDDYGYEYSTEGSQEEVADQLYNWVQKESEFKDYPEVGDYGDTNTTTAWAVENDQSIDPDEGAGAELISPVFNSPKAMLKEMKSLFDWSEENFGTNRSTGLHVTMSWQGETENNQAQEPNKLKMALLLGDEYLLAEFGRLRNSYTKSQYRNILKYAEGMKRGDAKSFEEFEKMLTKGIDTGKMNSIHFKGETDGDSGNNLVEFRIAGGVDYNTMYEKVVKACVRYATVMTAGYTKDAFRQDYINALVRLIRKSQEIDPKKLKDLEVVNHDVIDSAKNIVSKKEYFNVIRSLGSAVEYLQTYQELIQPDADKKWKQSIEDFTKATGRSPSWMGEAEERKPIEGYIQPESLPPSKRAVSVLKKAQDVFTKVITILAKDIADGNTRAPIGSKDIRSFRKFADDLKLDDNLMQTLTMKQMRNANYNGTDKANVFTLKAGLTKLFKKDIITDLSYTFLSAQDMDKIASKTWQFFQSDDAKDNGKIDTLADLFTALNPALDKDDVESVIDQLKHERQQNGLVAKLKGSGWNTSHTLLKMNGLTTPGSAEKLLKFLEPYEGFKHPTSKDHHINIRSDDNYEEVAKSSLVQKISIRLDHFADLKETDPEKYSKIRDQLIDLGLELIETIKEDEDSINTLGFEQGRWSLSLPVGKYDDYKDMLLRFKGGEKEQDANADPFDSGYNFPKIYDDWLVRTTLGYLVDYYSKRQTEPEKFKTNEVKSVIKKNFAGIKKFLDGLDKIFTAEKFTDLKAEISNKDRYLQLNKDFEKNVRGKALASFNVPNYSYLYIRDGIDFLNNLREVDLTDKDDVMYQWYRDTILPILRDGINSKNLIWVIPSAHEVAAEDAFEGLELIDKMEANNNYYYSWRKKNYKRILNKFKTTYGIDYEELQEEEFTEAEPGSIYSELKKLNVDVTRKGDSRKGAPGQQDLLSDEQTENPLSGEPLNRSSAMMWSDSEEQEQKRFKAFDWNVYPEAMKGLVAKELEDMKAQDGLYSFKIALENALEKAKDKGIKFGPNKKELQNVAGVGDMEGDSSNQIGRETNWINLANYLEIEKGVENQGVELLKKTFEMYNSNVDMGGTGGEPMHAAKGYGMERWIDAVMKAKAYIEKNYTVSGGNYFRKDAEGNAGDDVSGVYGNASGPTINQLDDYDNPLSQARADHPGFNTMMQNGMQNYLARGEVNDLVGFLNNPDNDNVFKSAVLNTLANRFEVNPGYPFDSFQDALAVTRRYGYESVFAKFDKLPLQEQLEKLQKINISKLNNVYEGRLKNAWMSGELNTDLKPQVMQVVSKNPMRPKKPYNAQEHRENVIKSIMTKQKVSRANAEMQVNAMVKRDPNYFTDKEPVKESVPNNTKIRVLNKLLAEPFPASDLKKQMDAYFALPDPQMIKDFRNRQSEGGKETCLRSVLRNYIKMKLHPKLQSSINLNESKDDLIAKIDALPDDEGTRKLVNYIEQLIDDMGVGGKIKSLSNQLEVIPDVDVKKSVNQIAKIIASIEMSPQERAELFVNWKADKLVNVDALLSTSTVSLETIFNGYGEKGESHITELVDDLNQVVQYGIGPGEFALAVLSQRIEGIGASSGDDADGEGEGKGDLLIDGSPIELKTTNKNSARFNDRQVNFSDSYKSMVTAFFTKYDEKFKELEAQGLKLRVKSGMQQNHVMAFLKEVPEAEKEIADIISEIFTALNVSGGPIARYLAQGDKNQAMQLIAQSNVNNYLTHKRKSGNLAGILFLDLNKQAFTFIKEVSDLEGTGLRLHAKTNYLITTSENPFANTSIVDTGA